jgi:hypothetical protein
MAAIINDPPVRGANRLPNASDWTFELIDEYFAAIKKTADRFKLDTYPVQLEVISAEQMLDAYASVGMPVNYRHWSFGKQFISSEKNYRRGHMGLAYEIVINSDPCIAYLMEENTLPMQALVMAHACFGHNSFFKGNYLFRMWTDASSIVDYLVYAKGYIAECEERHGLDAVEEVLDACHALMNYGVDRYRRPQKISMVEEEMRRKDREAYLQQQINDLWRTLPRQPGKQSKQERRRFPEEPQENLLYFIEKNAPLLEPWQREVVRIVRKVAQYFYPQRQTQVMNEASLRPRIESGVTRPSFRLRGAVALHVIAAPDRVRGDAALIPFHVIAGLTRNPSPPRPAPRGSGRSPRACRPCTIRRRRCRSRPARQLVQRQAVAGIAGRGQHRCQRAALDTDHLGVRRTRVAVHPRLDHHVDAAALAQEPHRLGIRRDDAGQPAQFGRHVGQRGALVDGQRSTTGPRNSNTLPTAPPDRIGGRASRCSTTSLAVTPSGSRPSRSTRSTGASVVRTAPVMKAFAMSVVPTPKATQPSAPLCGVCESVPTTTCPGSA